MEDAVKNEVRRLFDFYMGEDVPELQRFSVGPDEGGRWRVDAEFNDEDGDDHDESLVMDANAQCVWSQSDGVMRHADGVADAAVDEGEAEAEQLAVRVLRPFGAYLEYTGGNIYRCRIDHRNGYLTVTDGVGEWDDHPEAGFTFSAWSAGPVDEQIICESVENDKELYEVVNVFLRTGSTQF